MDQEPALREIVERVKKVVNSLEVCAGCVKVTECDEYKDPNNGRMWICPACWAMLKEMGCKK